MKPGDQPDPAFVKFFAGDWQTLLETVTIPGWQGPVSWDRRAAYLLWTLGSHYDAETPWHWLEVLKQVVSPRPAIVGTPAPVNPASEWPSLPTPEGVQLVFNSADW